MCCWAGEVQGSFGKVGHGGRSVRGPRSGSMFNGQVNQVKDFVCRYALKRRELGLGPNFLTEVDKDFYNTTKALWGIPAHIGILMDYAIRTGAYTPLARLLKKDIKNRRFHNWKDGSRAIGHYLVLLAEATQIRKYARKEIGRITANGYYLLRLAEIGGWKKPQLNELVPQIMFGLIEGKALISRENQETFFRLKKPSPPYGWKRFANISQGNTYQVSADRFLLTMFRCKRPLIPKSKTFKNTKRI